VIIVAHSNSDITYIGRTNCNGGVLDLMVSAEKDARIQTLLMSTGLGFAKSFASFDGPGACIEQSFLHTGKDKDSCALSAELFHEAPNTKGSIEVRGILRDQARSNIQGMIRVVDTATGTKSELVERVLLLSDKARCDAVPGLDILTDDVQVSHSASVKQADKEQLFYLMSRGLDEAAARQLIVDGFFEGLLGKFGVEI
jgi:Fe-S cluster assembly scaffold protein SufB